MQVPTGTRKILTPFVILVFIALASPGFLVALMAATTHGFLLAMPSWGWLMLDHAGTLNGTAGQVISLIAASLPALASVVCFRKPHSTKLTGAGNASLLILLVGVSVGVLVLLYLDPELIDRHLYPGATKSMRDPLSAATKASFTYLLLLIGLRLEAKS